MGIGYIPPSDKVIAGFDLKPCPFCGKKLILTSDHHGAFWEHPDGSCWERVAQVVDEKDADAWNTRREAKS